MNARPAVGARAVLRTPGATPLILSSLVAAVPGGVVGVLLVLHMRELGESYALAGVVASAYGLGLAASAPLVGRLVDRHGQTRVLAIASAITALAVIGLAVAPRDAPAAAPILLALAGGLSHPPVGACTRTLLPDLFDDDDALHSAYTLESSAIELSYIGGLVFVGLVASLSTRVALWLDALFLIAGTAWFLLQPVSRRWRPGAGVQQSLLGALRSSRVVVMIATITLFAVSFGALEVAVNAFASEHGERGATGPLVAIWGLGSLIGGIVAAGFAAPSRPARRLMALLVAMAIADAVLIGLTGTWALVPMLLVAGFAIAPIYGVIHSMTGIAASAGTSTEAFAWLGTGTSAGFSLGAALGGTLAHVGGAQATFAGVTAAVLVSAVVFAVGWRVVGGDLVAGARGDAVLPGPAPVP